MVRKFNFIILFFIIKNSFSQTSNNITYPNELVIINDVFYFYFDRIDNLVDIESDHTIFNRFESNKRSLFGFRGQLNHIIPLEDKMIIINNEPILIYDYYLTSEKDQLEIINPFYNDSVLSVMNAIYQPNVLDSKYINELKDTIQLDFSSIYYDHELIKYEYFDKKTSKFISKKVDENINIFTNQELNNITVYLCEKDGAVKDAFLINLIPSHNYYKIDEIQCQIEVYPYFGNRLINECVVKDINEKKKCLTLEFNGIIKKFNLSKNTALYLRNLLNKKTK